MIVICMIRALLLSAGAFGIGGVIIQDPKTVVRLSIFVLMIWISVHKTKKERGE